MYMAKVHAKIGAHQKDAKVFYRKSDNQKP